MSLEYPRNLAGELLRRMQTAGKHARAMDLTDLTERDRAGFAELRALFDAQSPIPSEEHLRELLDVCFFASLTQEEERPTAFSLAYVGKQDAVDSSFDVVSFASPSPLSVESIRRLAPAVDRSNTHIAAYPNGDRLEIWGVIHLHQVPGELRSLLCLVIDVAKSGTFIVRRLAVMFRLSRGSGSRGAPWAALLG